jgi:hypothetical protein
MHDRSLIDGQSVYLAIDPPGSIFVVLQGYVVMAGSGGGPHGQALGPGSVFGLIADQDLAPNITAHGVTVVRIYSAEEARAAAAGRNQIDLVMAAILPAGEPASAISASATFPDPATAPRQDAVEAVEAVEEWAPVRLIITEPEIVERVEYPELDIELFPFVVGREDGKAAKQSVDLVISDEAPFQLSRRHFMIEDGDEGFEIVDCGSYHGTIVNGAKLGNDSIHFRAPLNPGENEIIAGTSSSPFRFIIVIEGDEAP